MNVTSLTEEDYLIRLVLEGEQYISAERSAIVLKELHRRLAAGIEASFGGLAVLARYVIEQDLRYAEYLISLIRVAPGARKPIGYFILEGRLMRPTQLLEALEEQSQVGGRLGEIVVRNGWLAPEQLDAVLERQRGLA